MCGIAGFCNPQRNYAEETSKWTRVLDRMNEAQKRRGPDDEGTYLNGGWVWPTCACPSSILSQATSQ